MSSCRYLFNKEHVHYYLFWPLTMGQFSKVLLAIDNAHTVPQRALEGGPDLSGLNQVYGPNHPTPSV